MNISPKFHSKLVKQHDAKQIRVRKIHINNPHDPISFGGRQGSESGPQKQTSPSPVARQVHTPVGKGVARSSVEVEEVQIVVLNGLTSVKMCSHSWIGLVEVHFRDVVDVVIERTYRAERNG